MKRHIITLMTAVLASFPLLASAQAVTIQLFLHRLSRILDGFIPFIIGLAVFVILWGIFTYITHAAEEEKREEAKKFIVYGIIGVFFMLSLWGFVNILVNTFILDTAINPAQIPKVPTLAP